MVAMQCTRQELADTLRQSGFAEIVDEVLQVLPDPVDPEHAARILQGYGVTKDELISRMGGSP
jgi:hypothetical protein